MSLVLKDEGFQLPSPQVKVSYLCAEKLRVWMFDPTDSSKVQDFTRNLVYHLKQSFVDFCHSHATQERM